MKSKMSATDASVVPVQLNWLGAVLVNAIKHGLGEERENVVISPYSLGVALAMAGTGATLGGQCEREFLSFFGGAHGNMKNTQDLAQSFETLQSALSSEDAKALFSQANSIWVKQGCIGDAYIQAMAKYFDAMAAPLTTKEPINKFVEAATKGKIREILPFLSDAAQAVLVNAVYFKGSWVQQFEKRLTRPAPFFVTSTSMEAGEDATMQVDMMMQTFKPKIVLHQEDVPLGRVVSGLGDKRRETYQAYCDIVVLPYKKPSEVDAGEAVEAQVDQDGKGNLKGENGKGPAYPGCGGKGDKGGKDSGPINLAAYDAQFRAVVILPSASSQSSNPKQDVDDLFTLLQNELSPAHPNSDVAKLLYNGAMSRNNDTLVNVGELDMFVPKFKLEFGIEDLNPVLKSDMAANPAIPFPGSTATPSITLSTAFSAGSHFEAMGKPGVPLKIDNVFHKAIIEVDEEGTVAAAATAVVMGKGKAAKPAPKKVFRCDRPFVFCIQHVPTKSLVFMAKVVRPGKL